MKLKALIRWVLAVCVPMFVVGSIATAQEGPELPGIQSTPSASEPSMPARRSARGGARSGPTSKAQPGSTTPQRESPDDHRTRASEDRNDSANQPLVRQQRLDSAKTRAILKRDPGDLARDSNAVRRNSASSKQDPRNALSNRRDSASEPRSARRAATPSAQQDPAGGKQTPNRDRGILPGGRNPPPRDQTQQRPKRNPFTGQLLPQNNPQRSRIPAGQPATQEQGRPGQPRG